MLVYFFHLRVNTHTDAVSIAKPGTPPKSHALNGLHLTRRSAPPHGTALRAVPWGSAPRRGVSSLETPTGCRPTIDRPRDLQSDQHLHPTDQHQFVSTFGIYNDEATTFSPFNNHLPKVTLAALGSPRLSFASRRVVSVAPLRLRLASRSTSRLSLHFSSLASRLVSRVWPLAPRHRR